MWNYLLEHLIDIVCAGVSALLVFITRSAIAEKRKYQKMLEEKENADVRYLIQQEIRPVVEELHRLEKQIQEVKTKECEDIERLNKEVEKDIGLILASYKFRLVQLCIAYLKQGYMTTEQFNQLSEFYKVYHGLNGNGQAQEYYERAIKLPIHNSDQIK